MIWQMIDPTDPDYGVTTCANCGQMIIYSKPVVPYWYSDCITEFMERHGQCPVITIIGD